MRALPAALSARAPVQARAHAPARALARARAQSGMVSASRRLKLPSKAARLRSIIVAAAHPEAAEQRGVLEHFPDGAYRRGIVFEGSSSDADDEFDLLRCGSGLPTACATPQARARASAAACGSSRDLSFDWPCEGMRLIVWCETRAGGAWVEESRASGAHTPMTRRLAE